MKSEKPLTLVPKKKPARKWSPAKCYTALTFLSSVGVYMMLDRGSLEIRTPWPKEKIPPAVLRVLNGVKVHADEIIRAIPAVCTNQAKGMVWIPKEKIWSDSGNPDIHICPERDDN